jgi:hypothetical protein
MGWIGFDLDGTLALWGYELHPVTRETHYDVLQIGPPIPAMVALCKSLIVEGKEVRIFTARVGPATEEECLNAIEPITPEDAGAVGMATWAFNREQGPHLSAQAYWQEYQRSLIECWCANNLGTILPITATKDFHMWQLYDDRCIQVVSNDGRTVEGMLAETLKRIGEIEASLEGIL